MIRKVAVSTSLLLRTLCPGTVFVCCQSLDNEVCLLQVDPSRLKMDPLVRLFNVPGVYVRHVGRLLGPRLRSLTCPLGYFPRGFRGSELCGGLLGFHGAGGLTAK
jgi:hypothetical protein